MKNNIIGFFHIIDRSSYLGNEKDNFYSIFISYIIISTYCFSVVGGLVTFFFKSTESVNYRSELIAFGWPISLLIGLYITYITVEKRAVFLKKSENDFEIISKKTYGIFWALALVLTLVLNMYVAFHYGFYVLGLVLFQLLIYPFIFELVLRVLREPKNGL